MNAVRSTRKRLPRLRFALKHPIRTLCRNHRKSVDFIGFGLLQLTLIGAFVVAVLGWLARLYVSHVP
ncbi:hypothetical protein [Streptomyces sp. NPDC005408]|uniref:hypothetical protein n=1 Tax=Streptomyces sp. NPDC005408 TaxID=3155341 RepID=UPI0033AA031E